MQLEKHRATEMKEALQKQGVVSALENGKLVKDLDKEVGAGAAPGIVGATPWVPI